LSDFPQDSTSQTFVIHLADIVDQFHRSRREKCYGQKGSRDNFQGEGHFNMKLTTDVDLPDKIPIDDQGEYGFNGSVKACASWEYLGCGYPKQGIWI
jgi:hypothetical protein